MSALECRFTDCLIERHKYFFTKIYRFSNVLEKSRNILSMRNIIIIFNLKTFFKTRRNQTLQTIEPLTCFGRHTTIKKNNINPIRQDLRRVAGGAKVMVGRANLDIDAPNVV